MVNLKGNIYNTRGKRFFVTKSDWGVFDGAYFVYIELDSHYDVPKPEGLIGTFALPYEVMNYDSAVFDKLLEAVGR